MYLALLGVAFLWGVTNPFIRRGSKGINELPQKSNALLNMLNEFLFLFTNPVYLISMAINFSGSFLFYYLLSQADISLVVPLCNALTFLFTTITGRFLGEDTTNWSMYLIP